MNQNTSPVSSLDERLKWVDSFSKLLDNQFLLPGTKFRFGLDPILGLLPVVGDMTSFAMSGVLVMTMAKHGASRALVIRMLFNIFLDAVIGSIPVVGWLFDFGYKANQRNVELLRKHYQEGKYQGKGTGFVLAVLVGFLVLFGLLLYGLWKLANFLWYWASSAW
ncbi:DUF4112 domain-containing protein [Rufibacter immobilis]|uniref:DUF4112 domain-containing protein n=1 Tax=Rufibacter immobilis TaxID=1348778 RepID=A0A3M9MWK9_9BACT|nr:DUF4112 domain-containing protein [Rufibacter immobilis]RNI29942.1 DUF4112 domain-containing protein [Rufibacter immobilis]